MTYKQKSGNHFVRRLIHSYAWWSTRFRFVWNLVPRCVCDIFWYALYVPEPPFADHECGPFSDPKDSINGKKIFWQDNNKNKIYLGRVVATKQKCLLLLTFLSNLEKLVLRFFFRCSTCRFFCVGPRKDSLLLLDVVEKKFLNDVVPVKLSGPVSWRIARRQINSVNNEDNHHWYC